MKRDKGRIGVCVATAVLTASAVSFGTAVQPKASQNGPRPMGGAAERRAAEQLWHSHRDYYGPVRRNEPVGWVFGRLIGVNASAMTTFKASSLPPAIRDGR